MKNRNKTLNSSKLAEKIQTLFKEFQMEITDIYIQPREISTNKHMQSGQIRYIKTKFQENPRSTTRKN